MTPPTAQLCEAFGLGAPSGAAEWAARGEMGEVWRVEADNGAFALKRLFAHAGDGRVDIEARAVEGAVAGGVTTPAIVRATDGAVVVKLADDRWRAFAWMDIGPPFPRPSSAEDAGAVAELLGRLHALAIPACDLEIIPWFTARRVADDWRAISRRARRDRAAWSEAFEAALDDLLALLQVTDPAGLAGPRVLSHCDLTQDNVRRYGDGLAVIDWEHAGAIPPMWELALLLYMWAPPLEDPAHEATARAIGAGYRAGGGDLSGLKPESFAGAISAQLNWTLSRLYTSLAGANADERTRAGEQAPELLAGRLTLRRIEALVDAVQGA